MAFAPNVQVFSRQPGSTNALDDVLQGWLTPGCVCTSLICLSTLIALSNLIPQPIKDNLLAAANAAMGPSEDITLHPPVRASDGTWSGGLAIERGDSCKPVKPGTRCYTLANSYQIQKGTWAPAQGSKVNGEFDEHNLMRRNLNIVRNDFFWAAHWHPNILFEAVAAFPVAAMKQIPTQIQDDINDYTSMINIPPLGIPKNTAHNTLQLNIAPAVEHGSSAYSSITPFLSSSNSRRHLIHLARLLRRGP